jgi:hypothetical protein
VTGGVWLSAPALCPRLVRAANAINLRFGQPGGARFRPVADNATPEGHARIRRIAITILADELAGVDTVPAVKTNLATNHPLYCRNRTIQPWM